MSTIAFHSPSDEFKLRGAERAHMAIICSDLFKVALGPLWHAREWLMPTLPANCYLRRMTNQDNTRALDTWLTASPQESLTVNGHAYEIFSMALNTALTIGNDAVKLMARLHGQCEIHCYVEGKNRAWLARIILDGRASGILREDQGWENVISGLEKRDDEPVVCSYSVTRSFPSFDCLPDGHPLKVRTDDGRYDAFDRLKKPWELCMRGLRSKPLFELKPDDWSTYRFTDGMDGFEFARRAAKAHQATKGPDPFASLGGR